MIQATVAVYPIGQGDYAAVDRAIEQLRHAGLAMDVRAMHTEISGDAATVFAALAAAFRVAAEAGGVVMTVTVTNACPVPPSPDLATTER